MRDITFTFIKNAANRQADDAGRILLKSLGFFFSSGRCRGRRRKERWQKEGWQMTLIIMLILKHNYLHILETLFIINIIIRDIFYIRSYIFLGLSSLSNRPL